jgi:hypothetical protein
MLKSHNKTGKAKDIGSPSVIMLDRGYNDSIAFKTATAINKDMIAFMDYDKS